MNTASEICDLIEASGISAPGITQALKNIGGDMQTGVKRIASYFSVEGYQLGMRIGERRGMLKGAVIGLVIPVALGTGYYLYDRHKAKVAISQHEAEGKEILEAIKTAVPVEQGAEPQNEECVLLPQTETSPQD